MRSLCLARNFASVSNARTIYSESGDVACIGQRFGYVIIKTEVLHLPDSVRHAELDLLE